ncbi:Di-copper centre-containing protein [Patellaria atrata CBS 101060]|uniref:tyrosinase n=1 Tax=Patellaria atrata CBS 101060 TaxID=1346257 RepID=A0A9P4VSJ9_9PEZI|nr:Di-copper centre-containing protein [Patellaria atrata CBS 101060]
MVSFSKVVCFLAASLNLKYSLALPLEHNSELPHAIKSRQQQYFAITGVTDGGVQPRLEIRTLASTKPEMWNLFLLAMERFKAMDQTTRESYYQIAGIHGAPYSAWDRVSGSGNWGYCPHGSNIFGPWHKPYIVLFEQVLQQKAKEIANALPAGTNKDKYVAAANELRLPYWDWAIDPAGGTVMPASMSTKTISVTYPNGTTATIQNPLYTYNFNPLRAADFPDPNNNMPPFDEWKTTLRQPSSSTASAVSNDAALEKELKGNLNYNRAQLYKLFTQTQKYQTFSNKASGGSIGNLESLHDNIHSAFGSGHMGWPPAAAFDPAFWLHHCNVDRMLALWQALYPSTYVESASQKGPTYTIKKGSSQNANSNLTPFHRDTAGSFFTSANSRGITNFGYTYPELVGATNDTLKAKINALYGSTVQGIITKRADGSSTAPRDYVAKVSMPWIGLEGTFSVGLFLGDFNHDPKAWAKDPNFLGAQTSMSNPYTPDNDVVITNSVVLTQALAKKHQSGELESLDEETVVAYLAKNLHWEVQRQGVIVPKTDVPDFKVVVQSIEIKPAESASDFPVWVGGWSTHSAVTDSAN